MVCLAPKLVPAAFRASSSLRVVAQIVVGLATCVGSGPQLLPLPVRLAPKPRNAQAAAGHSHVEDLSSCSGF